jgi:CRISPR-associated protein Csh1
VSYFRDKVKRQVFDDAFSSPCALCQTSSAACVNLDTVFKFATFDKPGYLPGMGSGGKDRSAAKVFPACIDCYSALLVGREELDVQFCDRRTISGINIYVVPELITGTERMDAATRVATGFITEGVAGKESVFSSLARRDELLVFHFVFWESNQAQERIHLMVEDVPPSYLRFLEDTWLETADVFGIKEDGRRTLDGAFRTLFRATRSLVRLINSSYAISSRFHMTTCPQVMEATWISSMVIGATHSISPA